MSKGNLIAQIILMGTGSTILWIVVSPWAVIAVALMILGNNINLENLFQEKKKDTKDD